MQNIYNTITDVFYKYKDIEFMGVNFAKYNFKLIIENTIDMPAGGIYKNNSIIINANTIHDYNIYYNINIELLITSILFHELGHVWLKDIGYDDSLSKRDRVEKRPFNSKDSISYTFYGYFNNLRHIDIEILCDSFAMELGLHVLPSELHDEYVSVLMFTCIPRFNNKIKRIARINPYNIDSEFNISRYKRIPQVMSYINDRNK